MQKKRSDTSSIADTPELIISQAKESVPVQGIQANWLLAFSDTEAISIGLIQSSCQEVMPNSFRVSRYIMQLSKPMIKYFYIAVGKLT